MLGRLGARDGETCGEDEMNGAEADVLVAVALGIFWQEVRRGGLFTQLPRRMVLSETVRTFERI